MTPSDLELAEYAAAAYTTKPTWQRGDVRAVAFPQPDNLTTVVAYPGSENLGDWLRDLDAWPIWTQHYGFVHRGFYRGAMSIAEKMRDDLVGRRIVFCGHSLGGALAEVTAAEFVTRGTPVDILTCFGAPRPGGYKLGRVLRRSVRRMRLYRNANDPVPKVPWLPFIFTQPDELIEIGGRGAALPILDHEIARYVWALQERA